MRHRLLWLLVAPLAVLATLTTMGPAAAVALDFTEGQPGAISDTLLSAASTPLGIGSCLAGAHGPATGWGFLNWLPRRRARCTGMNAKRRPARAR